MAIVSLISPRALPINPTSRNHLDAQRPPTQFLQTNLHCQNTIHARNSMFPSIGLARAVSDDGIPATSSGGTALQEQNKKPSVVGCKACGREEMEKGCNGEGRIQGGIGTIPGFTWWPIKAYRPCPGFLASGGRYKRQGQTMDEVAFGKTGTGDDT
ncbi:hypothetical protein SUGI_0574900 [Cryptomeria japonica]|uniref:uncharacterized protein LOC131066209 n=1 Tax=Cryptomeria japonica TaxID=3369 RepID=UPI002408D0DB|nr:uncharacterized protein LOC131066209 [Cryptomeria japonica]XP_057856889.1 uncharacterized protein LOC131066209 [Cryptomeria japonica]GLJ29157.1 hypothetical protein SUGI_0574900 [Cryptomeria japonica]